ncbi:uncharacterized protein [Aristolochia californica]|uniref:uncharacterized protein n=1 Tax=Aristolochia californica TaxID=171875 RepID=UPI0035D834AB
MNPKEQCKAITLRSGREIERSPSKENKSTPTTTNNGQSKNKVEEEEIVNDTLRETDVPPVISFPDNPPILSTPLPYPQRFQKKKLDKQISKFLDIFKKIHINIPFTDALEQMPNYVKFLKDIISKKRRLEEFEMVKLSKECILCDLGASINLMPLSVCRKLGLGEMKQTTISLQLADRSIMYPCGIIEDVLVKVDKFIFPADFVVLDMEEDEKVPLILGRPFLATGRALIDVQKGELTLRVNKEEVMFNIYQAMKFPEDPSTCFRVDIIKQCVEEAFQEDMPADHLERCITTSSLGALQQVTSLSNEVGRLEPMVAKIDYVNFKEKMQQTTTPELKQLPEHLRYAFLGDSYTFLVIVAASLTPEEEEKLLHMLREHRTALGWTIYDLKAMKEVVRAEILKLLNAGIIYAISDSS